MSGAYNDSTLISIVMPAYNAERYIEESITSVINQTYKNWELIVIDDGSKDNTVPIIKKMVQNDPRIKLYTNNKNLGVSATRNKAVSLSNGSWIAFLDSDDMWEEAKLDKQMRMVVNRKADFIFTVSSFIDEDGRIYKGQFNVPYIVSFHKLKKQNVISCSSVLTKKKYLEDIKMEKDDMHEDYAVWLRILRKYTVAYGINEPLLIYRISKDSKSGNKFKTIGMTYKVFRYIGINPIGSTYYMVKHLLGAFKKYKEIFRK